MTTTATPAIGARLVSNRSGRVMVVYDTDAAHVRLACVGEDRPILTVPLALLWEWFEPEAAAC